MGHCCSISGTGIKSFPHVSPRCLLLIADEIFGKLEKRYI